VGSQPFLEIAVATVGLQNVKWLTLNRTVSIPYHDPLRITVSTNISTNFIISYSSVSMYHAAGTRTCSRMTQHVL
jgi:hypothetical protein